MLNEEYVNRKLKEILDEKEPINKCVDDSSWEEVKFIRDTFEGKRWWEVEIDNWIPDVVIDALYFIHPECLRYHFPVLLKWVIFNYDYADAARDCILGGINESNDLIEFGLREPVETIHFSKKESMAIQFLLEIIRNIKSS